MAEGLLKQYLGAESTHQILSAGVAAMSGEPASRHAIAAMADFGVDISGHSAKLLDSALISEADLVLGMASGHIAAIARAYPDSQPKLATLSEYTGAGSGDISDPFGGTLDDYRTAAKDIEERIRRLIERLDEKSDSKKL